MTDLKQFEGTIFDVYVINNIVYAICLRDKQGYKIKFDETFKGHEEDLFPGISKASRLNLFKSINIKCKLIRISLSMFRFEDLKYHMTTYECIDLIPVKDLYNRVKILEVLGDE